MSLEMEADNTTRQMECDEPEQTEDKESVLSNIIRLHRYDIQEIEQIYKRCYKCLLRETEGVRDPQIFIYGSIVNNLCVRGSDINVYVYIKQIYDISLFWENVMLSLQMDFYAVQLERSPKGWFISCRCKKSGVVLNIRCTGFSDIGSSNFVWGIVRSDVRLRRLWRFLKIWSKQMDLGHRCMLSSYCFNVLIIFFLQQPIFEGRAIVPSVQRIQNNTAHVYKLGVNYAHNLQRHIAPLSSKMSTLCLICEFFKFYRNFKFRDYIVAPFLGRWISKSMFRNGKFRYLAYEWQREILIDTDYLNSFELPVRDVVLCVQDLFVLTENLSNSMSLRHMTTFETCLMHAHRICTNRNRFAEEQLYRALLYDYVVLDRCLPLMLPQAATEQCPPAELVYNYTPCTFIKVALEKFTMLTTEVQRLQLWAQLLTEAVIDVITEIYKMTMKPLLVLEPEQRNSTADIRYKTLRWWISGILDLCRLDDYYKIQPDKELEPSDRLSISAVLTLQIYNDFRIIKLTLCDDRGIKVSMDHPLKSFFNLLNASVNFVNLSDKISKNQWAETILKYPKSVKP